MKKLKIKNRPRFGIQWVIVLLLLYMLVRWAVDKAYTPDFEAYCPFGGLQALSSYLVRGSLACTMTSVQIVMGISLLIGVVLFSKLFCGYICPMGTFSEWLGKLGKKINKSIEIKGITDKVLRILKYALLFITFYFTLGSSELFCKQYDPFFASFSLFDHDVTVWMGILSITIFVLGSVFFKLFWCKYLCPLGAISNIFKFFIAFAGVLGIYLILILGFNLEISHVWPLAIIVTLGYVLEVTKLESKLFPFLKITRDKELCTNCNLCSKACPQGIDVAKLEKVNHIDCNLCNECVYSCPVNGALNINKKRNIKWLPASLTIILIAIGLYMASTWQIPTIDLKFAEKEAFTNAEVYNRKGLKTVHCYGSSMAFARQIREVRGVLGISTYAADQSVKIYYDPKFIDSDQITKAIFSSSSVKISNPDSLVTEIKVVSLGINNFFDKYDSYYLSQLLMQYGSVYGFETRYGEPVETYVYFPVDYPVDTKSLKDHLEKEAVTYTAREQEYTVSIDFEIVDPKIVDTTISIYEYNKRMYSKYFKVFNNRARYKQNEIAIYELPIEMLDKHNSWLAKIQNHLSKSDTGVVAIQSYFNIDEEYPVVKFSYVKDITTTENIWDLINQDSLNVKFRSGKTKTFENPFVFINEGKVIEK